MLIKLKHFWHIVRQLSGEDAYAQYLKHHAQFHASSVDAPPPLSRKQFYQIFQYSKWNGINRCC